MATGCGYTFPQMREMTWLDVNRLWRYWKDFPPVHERIARSVNPAMPSASPAEDQGRSAAITTPEEMEQFMALTGGKIDDLGQFV